MSSFKYLNDCFTNFYIFHDTFKEICLTLNGVSVCGTFVRVKVHAKVKREHQILRANDS